MARRRRSEGEQTVSLFPFLSILACVIGTLTLMITAMALGQLDPESVAEAERQLAEAKLRAAEHERIVATIDQKQKEEAELRRLIAAAEAIRQELAAARAELERLEAQRTAMAGRDDASAKLLAELQRLQQRIDELQKLLPELKAEIERLKAELAKRDEPPPPATVRIAPGGTGEHITPLFVECTRHGVVILDGTNARIPRDGLTTDETFAAAMAKARERENGVMIFLVRPDGVGTYHRASDVARARQTRNGKLPVIGQGEIDLSQFEPKPE